MSEPSSEEIEWALDWARLPDDSDLDDPRGVPLFVTIARVILYLYVRSDPRGLE